MSSKVLTGEAANLVARVEWKRLAPSFAPNLPNSPAPNPGADDLAALRARAAELEREIEHKEQVAFRAGLEKGRATAEQEASARLDAVIERFSSAIQDLISRRRQLRRDAEMDLVKLAIAIARRVLRRELNVDPEAMLGLVKAALEKLEAGEIERVRVHPSDADAVKSHLERLRPGGQFEVVADARLERGAAVVDTARGSLDASTGTQLEEIERGLIERIRA